jgi:hypothetical protein
VKTAPSRLSFFKVLLATQTLWGTFAMLGATLLPAQRAHIFDQYIQTLRQTAVLPERRARSCPRVLRQPVSSWPRKTDQPSHSGKVRIKITRL